MSQHGLLPAAFLDRDGVINIDHGYVSDWEQFEICPGAVNAMHRLQALGYRLVIVTNQSGIGRGYYTERDFKRLMDHLTVFLLQHNVELAGVYFCPHHPTNALVEFRRDCVCRKPAPGMLLQAAKELGLALEESLFVGDKPSDMEAGQRAGVGQLFYVNAAGEQIPGATTVSALAAVPDLLRSSI